MAIEKTYLLGKNITLGCGFDLQAKAPLDSRQTVPEYAGLQALIDGNAAYEGMIVYDEETKKTYQAQLVDGVLAFREFGINEAELKDLIASETTAAMEFKGVAAALPASGAKGDMYKVSTAFAVEAANDAQGAGFDAKIGDSIVCDGDGKWFLIPSGDDIEDTWRPVTDVANDSALTFAAGDKLDVTVASNGTITYSHEAIDAPTATPVGEDEQTRTYITEVTTDGHGHITGYKTATENVEDTNTEYTFEGQSDEATSVYFQVTSSEEGAAAEVIYLDAYSKNEANAELAKKVDKVEGYSLVSDTEIARLAEVDNYDDEEVRGLIGDNAQAIEDLEAYVGTIPTDEKYADITNVISYVNKKAEETLAAAQGGSSETAASVKQQLDNYKSENDTRVKAAEDAIDAIEADYLKAADKTELSDAIAAAKKAGDDAQADITAYKTSNNEALAGVKATAEAAAVKTEVEAELAKKVAIVEGKDLIATSEIERLATLKNYDDTEVKADIAKKADAETMTTELGKKVDKVTGYSLVADTEIARLAEVDNYNDTEVRGLISGNADAIAAIAGDYLKAEDKTALQGNIDLKADKTALEGEVSRATAAEEAAAAAAKAADDKAVAAQNAVDTLSGKVGTVASDKTVVKMIEDLEIYAANNINGLSTQISDIYHKGDDEAAATGILVDEIARVEGLIGAEETRATGVESGLNTRLEAVEAFWAEAVRDGDEKNAIDTLKEIQEYIASDESGASAMAASIKANSDAIAAIYTPAEGETAASGLLVTEIARVEGLVTSGDEATLAAANKHADDAVAAEAEIARAAESALSGRIDTLEAIDHDAYIAADAELSAAIEAAKTEAANQDAVVLSESQAYADQAKADAIADAEGKVNALAEGAVATNAANIADIMEMLTWGSF
jgi:hypothetical protein